MIHQKFKEYLSFTGESIEKFCHRAGISTRTGYKLMGDFALRPCSITRIVDATGRFLKPEDIKRVWNWNKEKKNEKSDER
jgi:hypothetical protein